MVQALNDHLEQLCDGLNRQGLNYVAEMMVFPAAAQAGEPLQQIARAALQTECALGNSPYPVDYDQMLAEFWNAASHAGDHGYYPTPGYIGSPEWTEQLAEITRAMWREFGACDSIYAVGLIQGHPFYPVFWEFAFIVERPPDAFLFVGASSD